MKTLSRFLLPMILLVAGCSTLGSGDLATARAIAQGRYDKIQAASIILDRLIAQPPPANLTPQERQAWQEQTAWLTRTKNRLVSFSTSLRRVLDAPHPSGTSVDDMFAAAQLASDYARMGEDFAALMREITVEAEEDERRIAAATAPSTQADSTRVDSAGRGKGIAVSSPLKTRHDTASSTLSGLG